MRCATPAAQGRVRMHAQTSTDKPACFEHLKPVICIQVLNDAADCRPWQVHQTWI